MHLMVFPTQIRLCWWGSYRLLYPHLPTSKCLNPTRPSFLPNVTVARKLFLITSTGGNSDLQIRLPLQLFIISPLDCP